MCWNGLVLPQTPCEGCRIHRQSTHLYVSCVKFAENLINTSVCIRNHLETHMHIDLVLMPRWFELEPRIMITHAWPLQKFSWIWGLGCHLIFVKFWDWDFGLGLGFWLAPLRFWFGPLLLTGFWKFPEMEDAVSTLSPTEARSHKCRSSDHFLHWPNTGKGRGLLCCSGQSWRRGLETAKMFVPAFRTV